MVHKILYPVDQQRIFGHGDAQWFEGEGRRPCYQPLVLVAVCRQCTKRKISYNDIELLLF